MLTASSPATPPHGSFLARAWCLGAPGSRHRCAAHRVCRVCQSGVDRLFGSAVESLRVRLQSSRAMACGKHTLEHTLRAQRHAPHTSWLWVLLRLVRHSDAHPPNKQASPSFGGSRYSIYERKKIPDSTFVRTKEAQIAPQPVPRPSHPPRKPKSTIPSSNTLLPPRHRVKR